MPPSPILPAGQVTTVTVGGIASRHTCPQINLARLKENLMTKTNIWNREPGDENRELAVDELDIASGGGAYNRLVELYSNIMKKRDELQMSIIRKL